MTNEEKMLKLVLEDHALSSTYVYTPDDYKDLSTALYSTNPIVANVAKIIHELKGSTDSSKKKQLYMEIFNQLKKDVEL